MSGNVCLNKGREAVQGAARGFGFIVGNGAALSKTVKVALPIFKLIQIAVPGAEGVKSFADMLSTVKSFFSGLSLFNRGNEFLAPGEFVKMRKKGWQKVVSRVNLTFGNAMSLATFLDKVNLIQLGKIATFAVGNIPVFKLIHDSFIVISSGLGIWSSALDVKKADEKEGNAKKWLENPNQKNKNGYPTVVKRKYEKKIREGTDELKLKKWTAYKDAIENGKVDEYIKFKENKNHIKIDNCHKAKKRSWISIVIDIGKIFTVVLGIALLASNVMTLTAAIIVMSAFGIVSSGLGLAKTIYGEFGPKDAELPVFSPNVA